MSLDTDRHHLYWPRKNYTTALERRFRNLPCHVLRIPVSEHRHLHATRQPPRKPSHDQMAEAVRIHKERSCLVCYGGSQYDTSQEEIAALRLEIKDLGFQVIRLIEYQAELSERLTELLEGDHGP